MLIPLFYPEHNEIFSNRSFRRKCRPPRVGMSAFEARGFVTE